MARTWLIALLTVLAAALCAPLSAQARTSCPGEQAPPTPLNAAQVSDAIFCLSNQVRAHFALPALRRDRALDAAAGLHSLDMGTRRFFDHVNPDGLDPAARARAQGYRLGVGENIAYGYPSARAAVLRWMASAGHCRNLLSSAADLGVGTAVVVGTPHYTQVLGDYFSRSVDESPRGGCPYALDLDALTPAPAALAAQPDASELSLRALSLAPARFRAGRGTRISYTLTAPARLTFRIKRASGSRGRYRTMARRLTDDGAAGANSLRFTGRLGGRTLRPGRYRLEAVATGADGSSTRAARRAFVVVRR